MGASPAPAAAAPNRTSSRTRTTGEPEPPASARQVLLQLAVLLVLTRSGRARRPGASGREDRAAGSSWSFAVLGGGTGPSRIDHAAPIAEEASAEGQKVHVHLAEGAVPSTRTTAGAAELLREGLEELGGQLLRGGRGVHAPDAPAVVFTRPSWWIADEAGPPRRAHREADRIASPGRSSGG